MSVKDASRLRVAIADPTFFGQALLTDLLSEDGVRDIVKFSAIRDILTALSTEQFDLLIVDETFPLLTAAELLALASSPNAVPPKIISLESQMMRDRIDFLRDRNLGGVILKPVQPKRFSALFRALFRVKTATNLAA